MNKFSKTLSAIEIYIYFCSLYEFVWQKFVI